MFIVIDNNAKEGFIVRDKSQVAVLVGVSRNTVLNNVSNFPWEKNGFTVMEANETYFESNKGKANFANFYNRGD